MSYAGGAATVITTNASGEYVITGLTAGSYTGFTLSDADCITCSTTENVTMTLTDPDAPIINAGVDQEICEGETAILTANNPDGANISWDNGVTDGASFVPSVGTTTYTVTAELANCFSSDVVIVTVHPNPIVSAGSDIELCEGSQVTLAGSGANTYVWDNGIANAVPITPTVGTVTYTVTGTSAFGCEGTDQVQVTVHPSPEVLFTADVTEGCTPLEVNLSSLTAGNSNNCTYTINGVTELTGCNVNYTFTSAGCYDITLEVENEYGCISETTEYNYICIDDFPIADFSVNPYELSNLNNTASFTNLSYGASTYEWNFGDGSFSNETHPDHAYPIEGDAELLYTVELIAYSELGCSDTTYHKLPFIEETVYFVPNSFTPDGDNHNETFKPIFTSGFDPYSYTMQLFNRWGELIFESNNSNVGWDGTYGGKIVQDGVYVWKISFKTANNDERIEVVGHISLIR